MGIRGLAFGFESGSQKVLELLKTDSVDVKQNRESIRMCRDMGIDVCGSFIIGTPGETSADLEETYAFVRDNRLDSCRTFVLTPHPGTPVWFEAEKRGLVNRDMDWSLLNIDFERHWERHILLNESMTREEIRGWYLRFNRLEKRREMRRMVAKAGPGTVLNRLRHPSKLLNDAKVIGRKLEGILG